MLLSASMCVSCISCVVCVVCVAHMWGVMRGGQCVCNSNPFIFQIRWSEVFVYFCLQSEELIIVARRVPCRPPSPPTPPPTNTRAHICMCVLYAIRVDAIRRMAAILRAICAANPFFSIAHTKCINFGPAARTATSCTAKTSQTEQIHAERPYFGWSERELWMRESVCIFCPQKKTIVLISAGSSKFGCVNTVQFQVFIFQRLGFCCFYNLFFSCCCPTTYRQISRASQSHV